MCWMMVPVGILGAVVVIGVIAVAVIAIARLARGSGQQAQSAETPLAILKRRYAHGEISSEKFEVAKRQLSGGDDTKGG
jgi:uncharacterized membrane protein